ncbi:MAG: hypothetical protein ACLVJZ_06070 [[Clostridium] leptum]
MISVGEDETSFRKRRCWIASMKTAQRYSEQILAVVMASNGDMLHIFMKDEEN